MPLALANGMSANMTQAEASQVLVHRSLTVLAALGNMLPWEEALMTPINSLPVSTTFACDFESLPIKSQFSQSLILSCPYDLL